MMADGPIAVIPGPLFAEHESESGLRRAQQFLVRHWILIGATLVLVLFATGAVLRTITPRFTAHAEILLDPRREKPFGPDNTPHLISLDASDVESAITLIRGGTLLRRVVASEGLDRDPDFAGSDPGPTDTPSGWTALIQTRPAPLAPGARAAAALWRALRVERVGKAYALALSVTSLDPDKAARLANAVADAFVGDQREARLESSRRAAAFFAERLGPLGERLRRSEDALERFRRDHDLLATTASIEGGAGTTINEQQLAELNSRLVSAQAETAQAEARYIQARAVEQGGGALETIPDVVRSNLIGQLRQQQAEVARKEADLAARYSDAYPLLVTARAERREIERSIAREVARILANLKGAYDVAKSQEASLRASLTLTAGAAGLDSDLGPQLRDLQRLKLVDQTLFETYLAKARAAEQQVTFEDHDVRVISPAERPVVPAYPQRWLAAACMAVFGLGLGVALGLALDALDPGFQSARHAEATLGLPVIAAVPWLGNRERTVEGQLVDPSRYLASRPLSRYAEAVHCIRVGIRMSGGQPAKVVLVTSSGSGEGKSMIALSLALSATRAGQRVLLVDADLRSPALSRYFGYEHRLGLVDMLTGLVGTEETTVPLGGGLAIMPSGRRSGTAPDLFGCDRMGQYLAFLRGLYDLVIIDAAPAGAVIDARVLADVSDRIVFVVGWRATARDFVARNLRALGHPTKLAGIVLNKIDERTLTYGAGWARAMRLVIQRTEA